ncbi:hypothetical protein [Aquibacillus sediminis]|uniref:hypothetical protein n=1 Tax=Aquibacillus sediminis TaxID=2574734 RepID=UPI001109DE4F|nr:hypothetical protein [Aquibacillus sediminis]
MENQSKQTNRQLLRVAYPETYGLLMAELSKHHIHAYDVQATAKKVDQYVEIQVRFGEDFSKEQTQTFREKEIKQKSEEITNFFKQVGETCKEILIADYFKMVKP